MWRSKQWVGWTAGAAVLVMASALPVGFSEQPPTQPSEAVQVIKGAKGQRVPIGVSWSVIEDSEWPDLHGGKSRAVNREPDLWRYEF